MPLTVKNVHATSHRIVPEAPYLPPGDESWRRDFVVVRLETEEGIVAHGLTASAPTGMAGPITLYINRMVGPRLVETSASALRIERVWEDLHRVLDYRSLSSVWSQAVSAIDIALWDARGKYFAQPVSHLLGGCRDSVPAYITFGWPSYSIDCLRAFAAQLVSEGHTRLKMTVGGTNADLQSDQSSNKNDPVEQDAKRIHAVRDVVGPDVEIMIDGNCSMSLSDARRLADLVEPMSIAFFEEPVWHNDPGQLRMLRDHTSIPIAAGQNLISSFEHRRLVNHDAVDILQPNVCFCGGYTEGLRIANLARSNGMTLGNGAGWPHHNLHLQAAVSNGGMVEFFWGSWKVGELIYDDPPLPLNGQAAVPTGPGLGFEPNWELLAECEVKF